MSGGHFDYKQYSIGYIADQVEHLIHVNESQELNEWGQLVGYGFSAETIEEFKKGLHYLQMAQIYAQRIDWLVSGDDGEDNFHKRLAKDLSELPPDPEITQLRSEHSQMKDILRAAYAPRVFDVSDLNQDTAPQNGQ